MRMISKPVTVAHAVFIVWNPRAGRINCLSVPWLASMMLFRYFDVRCVTSFDRLPSRYKRPIALR